MAVFFLVFGAVVSRGAVVTRISTETGVPDATLQSERATTGLGWGELEKAHLLANASGKSFDSIVAMHKSGEGWGKIAHEDGLNLGRVVSNAHRSAQPTLHGQKGHVSSTVHGKGTKAFGNGYMGVTRGAGRGPTMSAGRGGMHSTTGMGHGRGR